MKSQRLSNGSLQAGVLLILFGLIFAGATLGIGGLDWGTIWPAFVMAVGAAFIVQAFPGDEEAGKTGELDRKHRAWPVMVGTFLLLLGAGFFAITLGAFSWGDNTWLWPFYLIMLGVAMLAGYFASGLESKNYLYTGLTLAIMGNLLMPVFKSRFLDDFDWSRFSVIGTWFENWFGAEWASTWWPVFPIAAGFLLLGTAALVANPRVRGGLAFFGIVPLLVGAFFLAITLGIIPEDSQGKLWPVYPLIVSVACLVAHFASSKEEKLNLISGLVLGAIGLVFLPITMIGNTLIGQLWPLLLIVGGLLFLVPSLRDSAGRSMHPR